MHILLVGQGNMAKAVETACASRGIQLTRFGMDFDYSNSSYGKSIAIHLGSGRQLLPLIELCEARHMPIIQGSTKLSEPLPDDRSVAIINAPNLSLPMIRFVAAFPVFAHAIKTGMEARIVESHQNKKADTSGTARAVAKVLGIPESSIKSVRDPDIQLTLGVPEEYLGGHAYHDFVFTGQGVEIKVSTKIRGRVTYAEGAITLAQALADQQEPLKDGIYELKDILHLLPTT
ncbi:MAG: hypothetical protein RL536_113 [Candidatus Parcubacteria bacterium]|jgi:dihydrodipicolinate reductase